jgi:hypothetical protein
LQADLRLKNLASILAVNVIQRQVGRDRSCLLPRADTTVMVQAAMRHLLKAGTVNRSPLAMETEAWPQVRSPAHDA